MFLHSCCLSHNATAWFVAKSWHLNGAFSNLARTADGTLLEVRGSFVWHKSSAQLYLSWLLAWFATGQRFKKNWCPIFRLGFDFPFGCGSKLGTQNRTMANGNKD